MVEDYYTNPAISQSQLKLLLGPDPSIFNTIQEPDLYFEEKKHFLIGDGVDIQLTQSLEAFNEKFHVSNIQNKPSDTIKSIVNQVYDLVKEEVGSLADKGLLRDHTSKIIDSCNDHNYQPNWKTETRVAKVGESWEYWEDLKAAEGKQVLSQEENDLISQIVMSIRSNSVTGPYFIPQPNQEILYQYPIYFSYNGVDCKALLDMVIIDHNKKTIQPIDIKTMGDQSIYFPKSLRQRRYDIQAAFYTEALSISKPYTYTHPKIAQSVPYTILPFKFIVESTTNPGNPLVFTCDEELLKIGKFGRESFRLKGVSSIKLIDMYYGKTDEVKGFNQLIEDYKWYLENGFEKKREIVEAQGEFQINWNGIIN